MNNPLKIIILLAVVGFGVGAFGNGDFKGIVSGIEKFFNSTDFGPLNGVVSNMKDAIAYVEDQIPKLIALIQQHKQ